MLRRLFPFIARIPYVLIAVMLTILLSWAIGFEDNRVVEVSLIEPPAVEAKIDKFNAMLGRIDDLTEVLVAINCMSSGTSGAYVDRPKVCLSCHRSMDVRPVVRNISTPLHTPQHDAVLLALELEDCKEECSRIRAELHAYG